MKKIILTIAGSDSSGGAGIQADIKAISANQGYAMSVITVVTAQNSHLISSIFPLPLPEIAMQLDAVFSDYAPAAIKVGALYNAEIIKLVAAKLKGKKIPIVVDPVMIAKSGAKLMDPDLVQTFLTTFKDITYLLTPNLDEAEFILGRKLATEEAILKAGRDLQKLGFPHVLIKGGHFAGSNVVDQLFGTNVTRFVNPRLDTINTHGSGCTLSAAIATNLGKGLELTMAVKQAITYTHKAIQFNLNLGQKHGPLDHFWKETNDFKAK